MTDVLHIYKNKVVVENGAVKIVAAAVQGATGPQGEQGDPGDPTLLLDQFAHFTAGVKVSSGLAADCLTFANTDESKLLMQLPSDDAYVNFNLAQGLHANPIGTRKNPTIYFGFNTLDGGVQEVAGEAQVFDGWEHHFAAEEGKTLLERHWIFGPAAGGTQYRPISSSMQLENDWVDISFCADKMSFFAKDASNQYLVLQAVGSIIINNKDLYHNLDNHYAYYVNQATPGYEIQHTYGVEGVNKWVQRITGTANDFVIYDPTTYGKVFQIIKSSGYVGICRNEESVDAQLHVGGAGKFEAGILVGGKLGIANTDPYYQIDANVADSGSAGARITTGGTDLDFIMATSLSNLKVYSGYYGWVGTTNDYPLHLAANNSIKVSVSSSGVVINESGADSDTRIKGVGDANLVFVDASTAMVGIGTDLPPAKFSVVGGNIDFGFTNTAGGNNNATLTLRCVYSSSAYSATMSYNPSGSVWGFSGNIKCSGGSYGTVYSNTNITLDTTVAASPANANIIFKTTGTERMRIDRATGYIGIGTAAPNSLCDIAGSLQCDSLRIDQAATVGGLTPDSYFTLSLNGTSYKVPCIAA